MPRARAKKNVHCPVDRFANLKQVSFSTKLRVYHLPGERFVDRHPCCYSHGLRQQLSPDPRSQELLGRPQRDELLPRDVPPRQQVGCPFPVVRQRPAADAIVRRIGVRSNCCLEARPGRRVTFGGGQSRPKRSASAARCAARPVSAAKGSRRCRFAAVREM